MTVATVLGKLAADRGHRREHEAVCLLSGAWPKRPALLGEARLATRREDAAGIDVVVASDVGALYLQIKSSRLGVRKFEQHGRRRSLIGVVIACDEPHFRSRLAAKLAELRGAVLERRARSEEPA